jgi:DNA replication protein DnaC
MEALIDAHARELHLPTVRARFRTLAEETTRDQQPPVAYLAALLEAEVSERAERRERRRLIDARFPLIKAPGGLPFPGEPEDPPSHDRRAGPRIVDR